MIKTKNIRRRNYRNLAVFGLGIFVAVFLFVFLAQRFGKIEDNTSAANLANFNAGYIISDYQMTDYNSMSEADIQNFLWSKGRCYNTNFSGVGTRVDYFSDHTPPTTWHVSNGHTVCLAEENMNGESAAHIIWQAAQDYRINPKVLIVLIQKETGLITDPIPNSWDYQRTAGYGCPDTAACSEKYYGFKNQIRNAASLFRIVMDGNSSYYPIGYNNVRYSPNPDCGSSVVYIQNLATSALYRYTPYQPNAGALAAGYGTAPCGAYGNRNFYLYFEDWFGGITVEGGYSPLELPRDMRLKEQTNRINPYNGKTVDILEKGMVRKYVSKVLLDSGEWCLRTEYSTANHMNACIKLSDLEEVYVDFETPRYLRLTKDTDRINPYTMERYDTLESGRVLKYTTKIYSNGKWYYRTEHMSSNNMDVVVPSDNVEEVFYENFITPRYLRLVEDTYMVNPYSGTSYELLKKGKTLRYTSKILIDNKWYYRDGEATSNRVDRAVLSETLEEVPMYQNFINPRKMILKETVNRVNPYTQEVYDTLNDGRVLEFTTKIFINDQWYYRTRYMSDSNLDVVVPAASIREL